MAETQNNSEQQNLIFSQENTPAQNPENSTQVYDPAIAFPLLIIFIGIIQFILRKWLAPVSDETLTELEEKIPTQSLIYLPQFGIFLIVAGLILLVIFNY
jgi:hypothetical protein